MQETLHYIDCSLPEGLTIPEYRRSRCAQQPRTRRGLRLFAGFVRH